MIEIQCCYLCRDDIMIQAIDAQRIKQVYKIFTGIESQILLADAVAHGYSNQLFCFISMQMESIYFGW